MIKKKRENIAIVFNEPITNLLLQRKQAKNNSKKLDVNAINIDLSEVGVVEEKEDIAKALRNIGYNTTVYNVDENISRLINLLKNNKHDLVFNLCEGVQNKSIHEMHIAGIFELMGIRYTGSPPLALGIGLNKVRTKHLLQYYKLPTPAFYVVEDVSKAKPVKNLRFPLIVKPSREDASLGIEANSIVNNYRDMLKMCQHIIEKYKQAALVEEYIDGRELNVAVMGNNPPVPLPISEIDMTTLPKEYPKIITYNAKWMKGTAEFMHTKGVCPAKLSTRLEKTIKNLSVRAYQVIGCRDYARIDFRLSKRNKPYILEVNPNPDISSDAGFARSAKAYGLTYDNFIGKIVEHTLARN